MILFVKKASAVRRPGDQRNVCYDILCFFACLILKNAMMLAFHN